MCESNGPSVHNPIPLNPHISASPTRSLTLSQRLSQGPAHIFPGDPHVLTLTFSSSLSQSLTIWHALALSIPCVLSPGQCHTHSLSLSLSHSLILSLTHPALTHSSITQSPTHSLTHALSHSTHSLAHSLTYSLTLSLTHSPHRIFFSDFWEKVAQVLKVVLGCLRRVVFENR